MAFSQSGITGVTVLADGPELSIEWESSAPRGTVFQVYIDHRLAWYGCSRRCYTPIPPGLPGRNVWVDVAAVDPSEGPLDFSSGLASLGRGSGRPRLLWSGGTYLDPSGHDDIQGFRVYRSATANGPVDLSAPLDTVPAYPGRWVSDGFGLGGFGAGGFGRAATVYEWTSGSLPSGVWRFAIVPYSREGDNRGAGQTVSVTVNAAPRPPAPSASGSRLSCSYSGPATRQVTLNWLASPST
jgi:hypothetical protein